MQCSLSFGFDTTNPNVAIGWQRLKLTRRGGARVAKPEWGAKRACHSCGARFYDLSRDTIVCPVCNTVYDPERQQRTRRGGSVVKEQPVAVSRVADDALKKTKAEPETVDGNDATDTKDDQGRRPRPDRGHVRSRRGR
jgi:uncharacterized protein (TIGR02300 family)